MQSLRSLRRRLHVVVVVGVYALAFLAVFTYWQNHRKAAYDSPFARNFEALRVLRNRTEINDDNVNKVNDDDDDYVKDVNECWAPRILWTYWNTERENFPPLVSRLLDIWSSKLQGWELRILTPSSVTKWIPHNLSSKGLPPANYADWLRLKLLQDYGGMWLDATIVINDASVLEDMYQELCDKKLNLVAIHNTSHQTLTLPTVPVLETWLLIAPPHSEIVKAWLQELEFAFSVGPNTYYTITLRNKLFDPQIWPYKLGVYWVAYAAIQKYLQQIASKSLDSLDSIMKTYDSSTLGFSLHVKHGWNHKRIKRALQTPSALYVPLIKLTNWDRRELGEDWTYMPLFMTCS